MTVYDARKLKKYIAFRCLYVFSGVSDVFLCFGDFRCSYTPVHCPVPEMNTCPMRMVQITFGIKDIETISLKD